MAAFPNDVESTAADYSAVSLLFSAVHTAMESGETHVVEDAFLPHTQAAISQLGSASGANGVASLLQHMAFPGKLVRYRIVNPYIAIDNDRASQSAYLLGTVGTEATNGGIDAFLFGGHYVATYQQTAAGWRIADLRFQLDWNHGDRRHVSGWTLDKGPGRTNPSPVIVSELDAPWRATRQPQPGKTEAQLVAEVCIRYAWGLDQADFSLLATAFTDNAVAEMVPFGPMSGRREIVGRLKDLRNGQPYMQHAASDFVVNVRGDRATMQIHRIVPFMPTMETLDAPIFGARYEGRLRLEDGVWKFEWLQYFPGWISLAEAGEGDRR
ncbi:nuclear transport factor 2 family protein [Arthrobacter sp. NPDC080031]|uniref:nuclear transport factor 2 family protein n=1 Tax=Arthrobacter sp. NPDC080031 TaxID=3155918 RepID=UPI00344B1BF2